jgi:hypothetical protein
MLKIYEKRAQNFEVKMLKISRRKCIKCLLNESKEESGKSFSHQPISLMIGVEGRVERDCSLLDFQRILLCSVAHDSVYS